MDDALKLEEKDPEIEVGEKKYQEMLALVKTADSSIGNIAEGEMVKFGTNFYQLFMSIGLRESKPNSAFVKVYFEKAEELYGDKWKKFLQENTDLINKILKALEGVGLHGKLWKLYNDLLMNPKTRYLADRADRELNLESIAINAWNKLNPLLKQASETMAQYGINPKDFYG
ncbi:MAG: hypothetical protein ABIG99_00955 [Patescibacteria group bacterium]